MQKLKPGESRPVKVTVYEYRCARCDHEGTAVGELPKRCSSCKSPYWMDAPGLRPRGRPPKKP